MERVFKNSPLTPLTSSSCGTARKPSARFPKLQFFCWGHGPQTPGSAKEKSQTEFQTKRGIQQGNCRREKL